MSKKILLIDNDPAFAGSLTEALEAAGFGVRVTGDGKEGLELARDLAPDAIVLCVELPRMSGYILCGTLRKDEGTRDIPLVLTSSEATPETFEAHAKLKGRRADAYLLKPFTPEGLLEVLGGLVGLPEPEPVTAEDADDEEGEVLSLDEEVPLDALEALDGPAEELEAGDAGGATALDPMDAIDAVDALGEAGAPEEPPAAPEDAAAVEALAGDLSAVDEELPGLDLASLPDEPADAEAPGSVEDDALKLLDDAFDGLAAPSPDGATAMLELEPAAREHDDAPVRRAGAGHALDDLDAAAASIPDLPGYGAGPDEAPAADLSADEEADRSLDALALDEEPERTDAVGFPLPPPEPPRPRGASAELLRAAGIPLIGAEVPPRGAGPRRREEDAARDADLARLREALAAAEERLRAAEASAREAAARADTAEERAGAAETRLEAAETASADARARAEQAETELARRAAEQGRVEALERALEEARGALDLARGEVDGAKADADRRTADLEKRVQALEAQNAKNEERVLKAYQKIKGDEKVRERTRKALAIALQLLEDGLPAEAEAARARIAAAASGREPR